MEIATKNKVVKGVMSTGIGTLFVIFFGFVNTMFAVRLINKEDFGTYLLLQIMISLGLIISDFGLNLSCVKSVAETRDRVEHEKISSTLIIWKIIATLGLSIFALIFQKLIVELFHSDSICKIIWFFPLLMILEGINSSFLSLLQGHGRFRAIALIQIIASLSNMLFVILFLMLFKKGLVGLIYARSLALVFSILYQLRSLQKRYSWRFDRTVFKKLFRFGYPLGINSLLTFVFNKIDNLIIGILLGPVGIAFYGVASKIPDGCRQLFESFRLVYFPSVTEFFSNDDGKVNAEKFLNKSLNIISFLGLLLTFTIMIFKNEIVTLLFTNKYQESAPVLFILILSLSIGVLGNIMGTTLVAAGYSSLPFRINIFDASTNIVANLILIPRFRIIGAAYAALIARFVTIQVNIYYLLRKKIRINVKIIYRHVFLFIIIFIIYNLLKPANIFGRGLFIVFYLGSAFGLSIISISDLAMVLRTIKTTR